MTSVFEASFSGATSRSPLSAKRECRICWYVYDPALGDAVWQIGAGTAFADLPPHWRCPNCDGDREQFLVIDDES
ncbi:MAG: rubredoxin [Burkholderiales bacterium]